MPECTSYDNSGFDELTYCKKLAESLKPKPAKDVEPFPKFPDFPPEVRQLIWRMIVEADGPETIPLFPSGDRLFQDSHRQFHLLDRSGNPRYGFYDRRDNAALRINRESRTIALLILGQPAFTTNPFGAEGRHGFYANFVVDIFSLDQNNYPYEGEHRDLARIQNFQTNLDCLPLFEADYQRYEEHHARPCRDQLAPEDLNPLGVLAKLPNLKHLEVIDWERGLPSCGMWRCSKEGFPGKFVADWRHKVFQEKDEGIWTERISCIEERLQKRYEFIVSSLKKAFGDKQKAVPGWPSPDITVSFTRGLYDW